MELFLVHQVAVPSPAADDGFFKKTPTVHQVWLEFLLAGVSRAL